MPDLRIRIETQNGELFWIVLTAGGEWIAQGRARDYDHALSGIKDSLDQCLDLESLA